MIDDDVDDDELCRAAAALMMNEDLHKFGRTRLERSEFALNGMVNPASRQIYLTFPADSTFREEDVSNYFRLFFYSMKFLTFLVWFGFIHGLLAKLFSVVCVLVKHLWTSSRREDPISAEAYVWVCDICISRDSETHSIKRKPSFCM